MPARRIWPALLLLAAWVPSGAVGAAEILQAANGQRGLVMHTEQGRAAVERPGGGRKRIRLRQQEQLTDFAETRSGWVAAGTWEGRGTKRLILIEQGQAGLKRLPQPASQTEPLRLQPRVMAGAREVGVNGLAWLEGHHPGAMSVRSAEWNGTEWQPVEVVSPPLGGSQTGLSGAVLNDGTWILVWAAYDGHDDEIYWSQKQGSKWTPPRPLAPPNQWPDITPTLLATRTGALVAWSRNDGRDYRTVISRFDGNGWQPPETVGGKGSVDPQLRRVDRDIFLLFNTASTSAWSVLEIQPTGRVLRRAEVAGPGGERPVITWTSSHQVGLRSTSVGETTALWGADR